MSFRDDIEAAMETTIGRGNLTGVTFNEIGWMVARAAESRDTCCIDYDVTKARWSYQGLPVTIDPKQDEPWTIQDDNRYGGIPVDISTLDDTSDGPVADGFPWE